MILIAETEDVEIKSLPSAILSTTNPTWTNPGANPRLHCERPAPNLLTLLSGLLTALRAVATLLLHL
jgi:hypothetical protein